MVANDRVPGTDADRHDDISRNGNSGFGGIADSAETGDLGDVISEGANVDVFAEACLIGLCFEGFDFFTNALISSAARPFRLGWYWFASVWPAAEFEAEFCGSEALATGGLLFLRQILRSVAKAAGVRAVVAEQPDSPAGAAAADQ
jgi:hypothetical protein